MQVFEQLYNHYQSPGYKKLPFKGDPNYHAIRKRITKELVNFLTIENSEAVFQYKNREGMLNLAKYFMEFKKFSESWEILNKEEKSGYEEGCLSVPGFYEEIIRPEKIKVTYLDRDGKKQTLMPEGLLAVVIQQEIDHLEGILMVDYISNIKRQRIKQKLQKSAKEKLAS